MKIAGIIIAALIVLTAILYFIPKEYEGAVKGKANLLFYLMSKI